MLLTLCGCNKNDKTVYVRDYTKVEFEGYSGYGSVIVTVDHKALNAALKKAGIESKVETCDTECSKEHVANGDVVTISFSGFDDALTGNSHFKMDPLNVKVSGLKEGTVVDAFDGVEIKVGGISPKLELSINNPKAQYTFATKVIRDGVEKDYNDGDFLKTNDELEQEAMSYCRKGGRG